MNQEELKMLITTAEYKYLFGDSPKEEITNDKIVRHGYSAKRQGLYRNQPPLSALIKK